MSRWWKLAVLVAGVYGAVAVRWIALRPPILGYDLELVARAARRLLDGQPLYLDPTAARFVPGSLDLFYGPPALAVASLPLAAMSEGVVRVIAMPLGLAAVLVAVAIVVRTTGVSLGDDRIAALLVGLGLSYDVFIGASLGAQSMLVLLLLGAAWALLASGRQTAGGSVLGIAAALRLYPAALALTLVAARRWHALAGMFAAAAVVTLVGLVVAGPDQTRQYAELALRLNGLGAGEANVTLAGLVAAAGLPDGLVLATRAACLIAGAGLLVLGGLRLAGDRQRSLLAWGVAVAGMLLVTPVAWDHYFSALVLIAAGIAVSARPRALGLTPAGLLPSPIGPLAVVWLPVAGVTLLRSRDG